MKMPVRRALIAAVAFVSIPLLSTHAALKVAPGYHVRVAYTSTPYQLISALESAGGGVVCVDGTNALAIASVPGPVQYFAGSIPKGTDVSTVNLFGGGLYVGRGTSFSPPFPHALGVLSNGTYREIASIDGLYDGTIDLDGLGIIYAGNPGFSGSQLFRFQPETGSLNPLGTMGGYSGGLALEPAVSGALFYADQTLGQIWRFSRAQVEAGGLSSAVASVVASNVGASYLSFDQENRLLAVTDYGNAVRAYDPKTGTLLETVATDDAGGYGIGKVQGLVDDRRIALVFSDFSTFSSEIVFLQAYAMRADFHARRRASPAVYNERHGRWRILQPDGTGVVERVFGGPGEKAVLGDFDGDRQADLAVCNPTDGSYRFIRSKDGSTGRMAPATCSAGRGVAPGDFNGDGLSEVVFLSGGLLVGIRNDSVPFSVTIPGAASAGTRPACGDFDGDGVTDPGVFIPASGNWVWYSRRSGNYVTQQWGWDAAVPVPADYDGDGLTDLAVYCPGEGNWYIRNSRNGQREIIRFGTPRSTPAPGDYDGDGRDDIAIYVEWAGRWLVRKSDGSTIPYRLGGPGWKAAQP